ncbi:hypothetical protein CERSUDRAFT_118109 [Gelatoporia subvermispora B]|uniref:Uncharacterized protein n=1 Tax=Ceriporiopsis subvermispora (strain B) TaxID=914234 RepID=M2R3Q3_CERS8|nr:hypothetical protein CERSUDRAFT_118109 [Gelatoporia subvermispora B]
MSTLAEVGPSLYQRFQYALGITSDGRVRIWLQSFTTAIRSIASYLSSMMRCYLPDVSDESQTVYRNWRAQEQALLSNDAGANWMPSQDPLKIWVEENVLSCADTVLMDDSFLDTVVRPCILDPQIGQDTSYSLWRARLGELSLKRLHRIIQKKLLMNHKAGRTLCGIALDALFLTTGVFRGPNIIQRFPQYFAHHILRRFDAEYLAVAVAGCVKAMSAMEEDDLARYDMATFLSAILGQCAPSIMKQKTSASGAVHWSSACSWPQALGMEVSAVAAVQHSDVRYLIDCTHSQLTAVEDTEPEAALEFFIAPVFLASIVPKPCYEVHLKVEMSRLIDRFCECSQLFTFRNMVVWDRFLNAAGHLSRSRGHPELQVKLHETLAASQLQVSEVFQPGGLLSALDEEESEDGYESQL